MSQTITADKPRRIKPTTLAAIGFAAPLIIYMLIFYVWPLIQNISMSMHRYTRRTFVTGDAPWSGFDIYKEILSDQQFWTILGQTLIFVFASIVFQYSIGLALAVFFNQNFKLSAALRGAFLVPWLLPPMISGTIWQWMMDADSGVITVSYTHLDVYKRQNPARQLQSLHGSQYLHGSGSFKSSFFNFRGHHHDWS